MSVVVLNLLLVNAPVFHPDQRAGQYFALWPLKRLVNSTSM